jgi:hypothetical protein
VATVSGFIFSGILLTVFAVSEKINKRKSHQEQQMQEHFQLVHRDTVGSESVGVRPGNILITLRDYNALNHLRWTMQTVDTREQDVVCMFVRISGLSAGGSELAPEQHFTDYEQTLFTRSVAVAEKFGKHISLLVVPANDVWLAIVQTASALESAAVVAGLSSKMTDQDQAFRLGAAWEQIAEAKRQFVFQVVRPDMRVETFRIGPHTPTMTAQDVQLVHRLWLDITQQPGLEKLHHSDIVSEALERFAHECTGEQREEILREFHRLEDVRNSIPSPRPAESPGNTARPAEGVKAQDTS